MIEAKELAYSDLRYVGEPRFANVPAELLSKDTATARAFAIAAGHATRSVTPTKLGWLARTPGAGTIYMSAIDREGNMVSLLQSNYSGFGSGIVAPGIGSRCKRAVRPGRSVFAGALSSQRTRAPQASSPHDLPAFMQKGDTRMAFGIMGGWNQSQGRA